jgi:hypothetical protein
MFARVNEWRESQRFVERKQSLVLAWICLLPQPCHNPFGIKLARWVFYPGSPRGAATLGWKPQSLRDKKLEAAVPSGQKQIHTML